MHPIQAIMVLSVIFSSPHVFASNVENNESTLKSRTSHPTFEELLEHQRPLSVRERNKIPSNAELRFQKITEIRNTAKANCGLAALPTYPEIGWTEKRFLDCTDLGILGDDYNGTPPKIQYINTTHAQSKNYIFTKKGSYIFITNGIVSSVQY